jgi:hypothetical protein
MSNREPVTDWKNWRDVFASERVVEPGPKYKSTTLHEWKPLVGIDDPRRKAEPSRLSSFVSIKGRHAHVCLDVTFTAQAIEVIGRNIIYVENDTINVEVIVWSDGRALVVAHNNRIIGGPWLAKIDTSTIPIFTYEVRNSRQQLEGVFRDKDKADDYADELRRDGHVDVTVTSKVEHP